VCTPAPRALLPVRCQCTVAGLDVTHVRPARKKRPRANMRGPAEFSEPQGKDVGDILIEEGLAVSFKCGTTRSSKTPRLWCEGHRSDLR